MDRPACFAIECPSIRRTHLQGGLAKHQQAHGHGAPRACLTTSWMGSGGPWAPDDRIARLWYNQAARVLRHPLPPAPVAPATRGWFSLVAQTRIVDRHDPLQMPGEIPAPHTAAGSLEPLRRGIRLEAEAQGERSRLGLDGWPLFCDVRRCVFL